MKKQITAVITCYNQEKLIKETLISISNQSLNDIDIIVVNDGSTDNSLSVLEEFQKEMYNLKVISTKNQGVSAARNTGIGAATTPLIFLMDGDDIIEEEYIQKLFEEFLRDDETVLAIGNASYIGDLQGEWNIPKFSLKKMLHGNIIFCGNMFKKEDWLKAGKFDETLEFREDWDFFIRLTALRPEKVKNIDYRGFNYRCTNTGRDATLQDKEKLKIANFLIFHKNSNLYLKYYDDPISLIKEIENLKWEITKRDRELSFLKRFIPNRLLLNLRNRKYGR